MYVTTVFDLWTCSYVQNRPNLNFKSKSLYRLKFGVKIWTHMTKTHKSATCPEGNKEPFHCCLHEFLKESQVLRASSGCFSGKRFSYMMMTKSPELSQDIQFQISPSSLKVWIQLLVKALDTESLEMKITASFNRKRYIYIYYSETLVME